MEGERNTEELAQKVLVIDLWFYKQSVNLGADLQFVAAMEGDTCCQGTGTRG